MTGREIESQLLELGVTDAEFSRESRLSIGTLVRIFTQHPGVKPETLNRARNAFLRLKAKHAPEVSLEVDPS